MPVGQGHVGGRSRMSRSAHVFRSQVGPNERDSGRSPHRLRATEAGYSGIELAPSTGSGPYARSGSIFRCAETPFALMRSEMATWRTSRPGIRTNCIPGQSREKSASAWSRTRAMAGSLASLHLTFAAPRAGRHVAAPWAEADDYCVGRHEIDRSLDQARQLLQVDDQPVQLARLRRQQLNGMEPSSPGPPGPRRRTSRSPGACRPRRLSGTRLWSQQDREETRR